MGVLRVKYGVKFTRIDPAGFRLLGSLDRVVRGMPFDLTVSGGCEGHPSSDPHTLGRAYDFRTHDLHPDDKARVLRAVMLDLQEHEMDAPIELKIDGVKLALATTHFFGQIENPGQPKEHGHLQQRKGTSYP